MNSMPNSTSPSSQDPHTSYHSPSNARIRDYVEGVCARLATEVDPIFAEPNIHEGFSAFLTAFADAIADHLTAVSVSPDGASDAA